MFGQKSEQMPVADEVRKCIAFVGALNSRGAFIPHGTGFFVLLEHDAHLFQYLVTAKHVLDGIKQNDIFVRVNSKSGKAELIKVTRGEWTFHPNHDDNVSRSHYIDIAVTPTNFEAIYYDIVNIMEQDVATDKIIHDEYIDIGDELIITGLFFQHVGEGKNIPIIRIGAISCMPEEPVLTVRGYMSGYLAEVRSIAGLSGSPVFVHMLDRKLVKGRRGPLPLVRRAYYLLGLMHGHYGIESREEIISRVQRKIAEMNAGIAVVIPVSRIIETLRQPLLVNRRNEAITARIKSSGAVEDAVTVTSEPPTTADNPRHKEDFSSLVTVAARKKPPADRT